MVGFINYRFNVWCIDDRLITLFVRDLLGDSYVFLILMVEVREDDTVFSDAVFIFFVNIVGPYKLGQVESKLWSGSVFVDDLSGWDKLFLFY